MTTSVVLNGTSVQFASLRTGIMGTSWGYHLSELLPHCRSQPDDDAETKTAREYIRVTAWYQFLHEQTGLCEPPEFARRNAKHWDLFRPETPPPSLWLPIPDGQGGFTEIRTLWSSSGHLSGFRREDLRAAATPQADDDPITREIRTFAGQALESLGRLTPHYARMSLMAAQQLREPEPAMVEWLHNMIRALPALPMPFENLPASSQRTKATEGWMIEDVRKKAWEYDEYNRKSLRHRTAQFYDVNEGWFRAIRQMKRADYPGHAFALYESVEFFAHRLQPFARYRDISRKRTQSRATERDRRDAVMSGLSENTQRRETKSRMRKINAEYATYSGVEASRIPVHVDYFRDLISGAEAFVEGSDAYLADYYPIIKFLQRSGSPVRFALNEADSRALLIEQHLLRILQRITDNVHIWKLADDYNKNAPGHRSCDEEFSEEAIYDFHSQLRRIGDAQPVEPLDYNHRFCEPRRKKPKKPLLSIDSERDRIQLGIEFGALLAKQGKLEFGPNWVDFYDPELGRADSRFRVFEDGHWSCEWLDAAGIWDRAKKHPGALTFEVRPSTLLSTIERRGMLLEAAGVQDRHYLFIADVDAPLEQIYDGLEHFMSSLGTGPSGDYAQRRLQIHLSSRTEAAGTKTRAQGKLNFTKFIAAWQRAAALGGGEKSAGPQAHAALGQLDKFIGQLTDEQRAEITTHLAHIANLDRAFHEAGGVPIHHPGSETLAKQPPRPTR